MLSTIHCRSSFRWFAGLAAMLFVLNLLAQGNTSTELVWRDARELCIEGKGWSDTKDFYDRLPAHAEGVVRDSVWALSRNSAGLCVRFSSDATTIAARWSLRNASLAMPHMPATGVSGVDLYVKDRSEWRWLANGRPMQQNEEKVLVKGLPVAKRDFMLYLPLYNGVHEVKIGVPSDAVIEALPERTSAKRPIAFYGTSILQGGCASRPGMAYPSLLGRHLDWPTINLGFSGNAHSEPEVARLLAELDPSVYVLDPLANMTPGMVSERLENFILILRQAHPNTPIVLVENAKYPNEDFLPGRRQTIEEQNAILRQIVQKLARTGQKKLYLVAGNRLFGTDGEATVDGTHPTDLGFVRQAEVIEPTLRRALRAAK